MLWVCTDVRLSNPHTTSTLCASASPGSEPTHGLWAASMFSCPAVHCLQAEPFSAVEVTTSRIFEQRHYQVIKVRLILGWESIEWAFIGMVDLYVDLHGWLRIYTTC